jgi:hypothetical protein
MSPELTIGHQLWQSTAEESPMSSFGELHGDHRPSSRVIYERYGRARDESD